MERLWLLGPALDVDAHYETLNDADNGASYGDIRDGTLDPYAERRLRPFYKAQKDDVFPDMVPSVYLPPLWSRDLLQALDRVAPDHGCLIFPARIQVKGRRGNLPWTHSLLVPRASASNWFDPERCEAWKKKSTPRVRGGVTLYYPSKIVLRAGWSPSAPVMNLDGLQTHGNLLGVTQTVAKALLAMNPRRVFLAPVEHFTNDQRPSCDGRTDPEEIAAWRTATRANQPNETVPLTDWENDYEMFKLLRKDKGFILDDGGWIERRTDMIHQEWMFHRADGHRQCIDAAPMLELVEHCLARHSGLSRGAWQQVPRPQALTNLKAWQKATAKERRKRLAQSSADDDRG